MTNLLSAKELRQWIMEYLGKDMLNNIALIRYRRTRKFTTKDLYPRSEKGPWLVVDNPGYDFGYRWYEDV